jgi:hypothetical protein
VTVERADGVAVHDVHTAIYTSPSEWQTQWTTHLALPNVEKLWAQLPFVIKDILGSHLCTNIG